MCGFLVEETGARISDDLVCRRGPDHSGRYSRGGLEFLHFLLHITGDRLCQPLVEDDLVCLFNGELYSRPYSTSDGETILPIYREYGVDFAKHLDGEYAIAIYDFKLQRVLFATDPFATKPLWTSGLRCASYRSAIRDGEQTPPNTTVVRDFSGRTVDKRENHHFEFSRQFKQTFCDWTEAFRLAVRKRAQPGCYIGLSSGYDSGAIACELLLAGIEFKAYSLTGTEHGPTLKERQSRVNGLELNVTSADYENEKHFLRRFCEPYSYHLDAHIDVEWVDMHDDPGAVGASLIHRAAKKENRKIYLSGQGADEILCDYAKSPRISYLHGSFPDVLRPWPNFFGGCQRAYLSKEEFVAGAHGVEGRYPFLDASLVQEFLWLAPKLKNEAYKAPLAVYLNDSGFPFYADAKIGFQVFEEDSRTHSGPS